MPTEKDETLTLYTTAPKSHDYEGTVEDDANVGTHTVGRTVRRVRVPARRFFDQIARYWVAIEMAVDEEEFGDLVSRKLIAPSAEVRS